MLRSFTHSISNRLRAVVCLAFMMPEVGGQTIASVRRGYGEAYKCFHFYTQIP